jgi:dihydrofolate reductase
MIISLIAAIARNRVIGKDNQMIWRLSDDMKRFRKLTTGHHVLMGRKTWESLGKPLKNRVNLVVTRKPDYRAEGAEVFGSIHGALQYAKVNKEVELFVIGGGEIYKALLPAANRIYLTRVLASPEGDAFFPDFPEEDWMVTFDEAHRSDEKNDHDFVFLDLERRDAKNAGESFEDSLDEYLDYWQ